MVACASTTANACSQIFLSTVAKHQWRPQPGRACEYVLDFERIGRRTLGRSEWKGGLKPFNVYFVRGADYRHAVRPVGVAESTFDCWYKEVKRSLGTEFSRTGRFSADALFPGSHVAARENQPTPSARRKPVLERAAFARARDQVANQGNAHVEGHQ